MWVLLFEAIIKATPNSFLLPTKNNAYLTGAIMCLVFQSNALTKDNYSTGT